MREPGSGTRSAFEEMLAAVGVDSAELDVAFTLPANEEYAPPSLPART